MWITFDRRGGVQDNDSNLNFHVIASDKNDFMLDLRGRATPLLEATGVSKEQLLYLKYQIDTALGIV